MYVSKLERPWQDCVNNQMLTFESRSDLNRPVLCVTYGENCFGLKKYFFLYLRDFGFGLVLFNEKREN